MSLQIPSRFRRLYPGTNLSELLDDYFPANSFEVNGESFHREQLEQIFRFIGGTQEIFKAVDAFLVREPDNEFDANAVAVYVHEKKVGYIPKGQAQDFSQFLIQHEDGIWVQAAIRFVSGLGQYRLRFFAQTPFKLDTAALPILDVSGISQIEFDNGEPEELHGLNSDNLDWRTEQVSNDQSASYCGPITVQLSEGEFREFDSEGDEIQVYNLIKISANGSSIGQIWEADRSYSLLKERLGEVGGIALTTLYAFSADTAHFWFSNDLKPKAAEPEPHFEDWAGSDYPEDESDGGHTRF